MKRKLLYIPFYSQQDKTTGKICLNADANIRVMQMLFKILQHYFEIHVVVPHEMDGGDRKYFVPAKLLLFVEIYPNNLIQRFHFDAFRFMNIFTQCEYDLIINNCPELTKNLLACCKVSKNKMPKIISINHFPMFNDFEIPGHDPQLSYEDRQHESINISNLNIVFSDFIRKIYNDYGPPEGSIVTWPLSFDSEEIKSQFCEKDIFSRKDPNKILFIFPNRLSSTNYSNHLPFIEAIKHLQIICSKVDSRYFKPFEVAFTNTTNVVSKDWLLENVPNCICPNTSERRDYLDLLARADFSISLMSDLHGGIAVREGLCLGCLPIVRKIYSFADQIPDHYPLFVSGTHPDDIFRALRNAMFLKSVSKPLWKKWNTIFDNEDFSKGRRKIINDLLNMMPELEDPV